MRWADYVLIPVLLVAFWVAGALAAAGVYVGDVAPAGTELPAAAGELMFVLASLAMGALVGVRVAWPFRFALWTALIIAVDMTTTISVMSHVIGSSTCPTCDTVGVFVAPVYFALVGVALVALTPAGYGLRAGAELIRRRRGNALKGCA